MLARATSFLSRLASGSKPTNRPTRRVERLSLDEASLHVSGILNSPTESSTSDYCSLMVLVVKYPQLARMELFRTVGSGANDERSIPLVALATKRIGSTWAEHMEVMELVYLAFPGGVETRDLDGRIALHIACNSDMPHFVVLFLLDKCPWSSMVPDHSGTWPSLYRYFHDPFVYKEIVSNLIRAFAEEDKSHCDSSQQDRDDFNEWQNDLPSPLLVAFGMKIQRPKLLRLLILPNPTGECARLDLMNGNITDLANVNLPHNVADLLARRLAPWIKEFWIDLHLLFTIQGFSLFLVKLAKEKPASLRFVAVSLDATPPSFSNASILEGLPTLLRSLPNLKTLKVLITASSPVEMFQGGMVVQSISAGLGADHPIEKLSLHLDPACGYAAASLGTILSTCPSLFSICLSLNRCSREVAASLARGIRSSKALTEVSLSFSGKFAHSNANSVIEAIATSSSVKKLVLGALTESELCLPSLSQLTTLRSLDVSMTAARSPTNGITSNALLDLLEGPNELVTLCVSPLHLPPLRLCRVLMGNAVLERLEFCRCFEHGVLAEQIGGIVDALRQSNRTLCEVEMFGEDVPTCLLYQLSYYLRLNRAGRAEVVNSESATASTVANALQGVLVDNTIDCVKSTSICFELLRLSPHLWSNG